MTIACSRFTVTLLLACSICGVGNVIAGDEGVQFKATLVWGANNPQTGDPELKPVPPNVARKLGKLPFKWKYYYAVGDSREFSVPKGKREKVRMSKDCVIVVRPIDDETVELSLRGEGQPVGKVTQKLSKGHMLVTGGDAENLTAWFVVLHRPE